MCRLQGAAAEAMHGLGGITCKSHDPDQVLVLSQQDEGSNAIPGWHALDCLNPGGLGIAELQLTYQRGL